MRLESRVTRLERGRGTDVGCPVCRIPLLLDVSVPASDCLAGRVPPIPTCTACGQPRRCILQVVVNTREEAVAEKMAAEGQVL